jgi:hypothetical protein
MNIEIAGNTVDLPPTLMCAGCGKRTGRPGGISAGVAVTIGVPGVTKRKRGAIANA